MVAFLFPALSMTRLGHGYSIFLGIFFGNDGNPFQRNEFCFVHLYRCGAEHASGESKAFRGINYGSRHYISSLQPVGTVGL